MTTVRALRVEGAEGLVGSEIPYLEFGSPSLGPSVGIISGVHGCEYASMLGLRRFLEGIDEAELHGHIIAVPITNLAAFHSRTPFLVPYDGQNLNRCFPGDPNGAFTNRLAHQVFETVVRPADYFLDLHCGDQVEALAPFSLYNASIEATETKAREIALAYGLPYLIRVERSDSPVAGMASAAAAQAGIPAITAEAGGRGLVEEAAVQAHVAGLQRVFAHLEMLPAPAGTPAAEAPEDLNHFVWLRSIHAGWWSPAVSVGDHLAAGDLIGTVRPLLGGEQFDAEEIRASEAGVAIFITTSPAVAADGLLLGVGVP